jgi:hypothetical protein
LFGKDERPSTGVKVEETALRKRTEKMFDTAGVISYLEARTEPRRTP